MPQPCPQPALATGGPAPSKGPSSARSYRNRFPAARRLAALHHPQWRHRLPCAARGRAPRTHLGRGRRAQAARTVAPPPSQPALDRRHDWRAARQPRHRQAVWPTAENVRKSEMRRFDRTRDQKRVNRGRVTHTSGPRDGGGAQHRVPSPGLTKAAAIMQPRQRCGAMKARTCIGPYGLGAPCRPA